MQVTISKTTGKIHTTKTKVQKKYTSPVSTTFSGCYSMEKIGNQQICLVFDRGMPYDY